MSTRSKLQRVERIILTNAECFPDFINLPKFTRVAEKVMEHDPGLIGGFFLACAKKSKMSQGELSKEIEGIWQHPRFFSSPEWVDAALNVCRSYSPLNYPRHLSSFVMKAFRQNDENGVHDTFVAVCEKHDLGNRMDLASAQGETWGGLELVCQIVRAKEMIWTVKSPRPERLFEQTGERMLRVLIEHGADLERMTRANFNGRELAFHGILHRACHDYDQNPTGTGGIDLALKCGADWKRLLRSQELGQNSLRAIESHPLVRRDRLTQTAGLRATVPKTGRRPSI